MESAVSCLVLMFTFVINTWSAYYCESHESFTPTTNNVELLRLDNLMWKIITEETFPKHYQIYSIKNVQEFHLRFFQT